jgi:hypothetical protein
MKNKLTLKALKQELDRIKASKLRTNSSDDGDSSKVGLHGIKNSYINNLYSKSGAFWLYLVTGVLGYAHKIPVIGKVLSLLSLWYGRTTIWKILVKIRKIFIVFNAIIGVYIVFKSVGFSTDNLMAGFYGVGHTYVETLFSLTKRLFNWFVELFDHKVVPNVPGTGPNTPKVYNPLGWYTKPMHNAPLSERILDLGNLNKNLFTDPFNININVQSTPWYRDYTTWLWIAGVTCTLGLAFLGYKMIMDPTILQNLTGGDVVNPSPKISPKGGPSINVQGAEPDITLADNRSSKALGKAKDIVVGFVNLPGLVFNKLNPFNYIVGAEATKAQMDQFISIQNDLNKADLKYYPFTPDNPFDSWITKMKKHLFGETELQKWMRTQDRSVYDATLFDMTAPPERGRVQPHQH